MRSVVRSHGLAFQSRERQDSRCLVTGSNSLHYEKKTIDANVLENYRALVLDGAFRPLAVINWHRAVSLDIFRSVEVLEYYDCFVQTVREAYPIPAVMRSEFILKGRTKTGYPVTKRNILRRDRCVCVYCGHRSDLTIDHVVPVSRGGDSSWENLVTACKTCNNRKGNRTLEQLGWRLRVKPREPGSWEFRARMDLPSRHPKEWQDYIGHLTESEAY